MLLEAGWQLTETLSTGPGHAMEIARASDAGVVLAVGGDGTAHEAANGILTSGRRSVLGVLPVGTGNDFARALGIPADPLATAAALVRARPRALDVGEVNGRYFLTIAGAGFDGEVARQVNEWPKVASGVLMYALGILKMLVTYRPVESTIDVDGAVQRERLFLIAVGNTAWQAGGMWTVPPAQPDDGLLHAVIAGPLTRLETLRVLPKVFSGEHLGHPKVHQAAGRTIRVEASRPLAVQADGEVVGTLPAVFTVHPRRLTVLAPEVPGAAAPAAAGRPARP